MECNPCNVEAVYIKIVKVSLHSAPTPLCFSSLLARLQMIAKQKQESIRLFVDIGTSKRHPDFIHSFLYKIMFLFSPYTKTENDGNGWVAPAEKDTEQFKLRKKGFVTEDVDYLFLQILKELV